ncbi:hypothetical protein GW17_00057152 [Ensete ventricosum]|nr:hypothetical protein GW17_00057152 [Ensete ventricosum]
MSYNPQQQAPPPPPPPQEQVHPPTDVALPPAGYPSKDGGAENPQQVPIETKSRGASFWRRW